MEFYVSNLATWEMLMMFSEAIRRQFYELRDCVHILNIKHMDNPVLYVNYFSIKLYVNYFSKSIG